ncbi:hypothetical protein BDZ89DRAFT_64409 [Hymenopellis radicata]|nr:hypothetical protein BDZ89DRAFT_64409 [Hymenopellis radicata]
MEKLLDEVGKAIRDNDKCTWIVEDDGNALLNEYGFANLPFSGSANTSSHISSISSNAPSTTSLLSGKTVVAPSNESGTFEYQHVADTPPSMSVQEHPGNNDFPMPQANLTNALPPTSGPASANFVDIRAPSPGGFIVPVRLHGETPAHPAGEIGNVVGPSMRPKPFPLPQSSKATRNPRQNSPRSVASAPPAKPKSWFTRAKEFVVGLR